MHSSQSSKLTLPMRITHFLVKARSIATHEKLHGSNYCQTRNRMGYIKSYIICHTKLIVYENTSCFLIEHRGRLLKRGSSETSQQKSHKQCLQCLEKPMYIDSNSTLQLRRKTRLARHLLYLSLDTA